MDNKDIPPAEWPRYGEWECRYVEDDLNPWSRKRFYCTACGDWNTYGKSAYCPHCGAYMRRRRWQEES